MVLSDNRLSEYASRLEEKTYVPRHSEAAVLLNCEVEDLVTEVRNLRTGIRRLRERVYNGASALTIHVELAKLLEGKFE